MAETIHIGSESGSRFAVLFFLTICAAIGYVIYGLLARPETRRAEFIALGAASRRTSLLIAAFISGGLFTLICWSMFTGFSRIEVDGELLRLHYILPQRTAVIRRDQLTLLEKRYAYRISWRLAITTQDRQTYESQPASAASVEAARLRLAQLAAE